MNLPGDEAREWGAKSGCGLVGTNHPCEVKGTGMNWTPLDDVGFLFFSNPDGNGWAIQQISTRP